MGLNKVLLAGVAGLAMTVSAHAQYSNDGITLGVLTDMSGVYADVGGQGSVVAAEMAIEDYGGEFNGKPINLVSADHQNKADIGANIARQWADTDGVDAIFDILNSAVGLAVQQVATEKNIVSMNSGAATTALTNEQCSPNGIHYVYDTYALATGTGGAMVKEGGDSWFFIVADYAFGHALEADTSAAVEGAGGSRSSVRSAHRCPTRTSRPSCCRRRRPARRSSVSPTRAATPINSIKQAQEFGIVAAGQRLAGLLIFITDIHALGLEDHAGPHHHHRLVLGPQRRDPRIRRPLCRADERLQADHDPRRRLLLGR